MVPAILRQSVSVMGMAAAAASVTQDVLLIAQAEDGVYRHGGRDAHCQLTASPRTPADAHTGRAIPRANVDRLRATSSYAEPIFRLVKCPLSLVERHPAMPGM